MFRDEHQKEIDQAALDGIMRRFSMSEREAALKLNEMEAESMEKDRRINNLQDEVRQKDAQLRERDRKILELSAAFHKFVESANPFVLPVIVDPPQPQPQPQGTSAARIFDPPQPQPQRQGTSAARIFEPPQPQRQGTSAGQNSGRERDGAATAHANIAFPLAHQNDSGNSTLANSMSQNPPQQCKEEIVSE